MIEHLGYRIESSFLTIRDRWDRTHEVYAARCLPHGVTSPVAGVLHLPGGGQTVDPTDLVWWARRGFAAVSMDWENRHNPAHDPERKSRWAPAIQTRYDPIESEQQALIPTAMLGASASLDWISEQDLVDENRLGVAGISWGGYLTWAVAAHDQRVKAIVPVFGCGGLFDERFSAAQFFKQLPEPVRTTWEQEWDALALTKSRLRAPTCYCSATNDFFGPHSVAESALAELKHNAVPVRRTSRPNGDHWCGIPGGVAAEQWMRQWLMDGPPLPEEPVLHEDGSVELDSSRPIDDVCLWWSVGSPADAGHCWWPGEPDRLPALASLAFARVRYTDGLVLNSPTLRLAGERPAEDLPETWPDAVRAGAAARWGVCSTQFYARPGIDHEQPAFEPIDGNPQRVRVTHDVSGSSTFSYFFTGLGDPRWNHDTASGVVITLDGAGSTISRWQVTVKVLKSNTQIPEKTFTQHLDTPLDRVEVVIHPGLFEDWPEGKTWSDVIALEISGDVSGPTVMVGPIKRR
ncbi:MAG: acetylxylan esterase [Planctomycetota bacterium]